MTQKQSVPWLIAGGVGVLAVLFVVYQLFLNVPPLPEYDLDAWWGPLERKTNHDVSIRTFNVQFGDDVVAELKARIKTPRKFTPPLEDIGFQYGFNSEALQTWLHYWAEEYPFNERQRWINQYPHFKTNIQGLDIHYIRVTPKAPPGGEVVTLLMLHGWPSSILDFYQVIPEITSINNERNFTIEVIAPSLPGFGFSDGALRPGFGALEAAVVLRNLMHRIGVQKYYIHGGYCGAMLAKNMATLFPKEVLGVHLTTPILFTRMAAFLTILGSLYPPLVVDSYTKNRMYPLKDHYTLFLEESGYMHMQATKPDTMGIALSDSPAGLLAYILEKFSTGLDFSNRRLKDGGLNIHGIRDQLLDNVMIYWITNSITTSMRIYAETYNSRMITQLMDNIPTYVPTCVLQANSEALYQPRVILQLKYKNLLHETALPYGGRFLPWDMPEVHAGDVLKALTAFRKWHEEHTEKSEL